MLYAFNDAKAAERHETQYFEMFGNRGIYHKGWTAVTRHTYPWSEGEGAGVSTTTSGSSTTPTRTGASRRTSRRRCRTRFASCSVSGSSRPRATTCCRSTIALLERLNPDLAGRPILIEGNTQLLFGGMGHLSENCVLSIKNKSHSVTAKIVVPDEGCRGRHHRAGREHRRVEPLREGRQAQVLLQLGRLQAVHGRGDHEDSGRRASGAHGIRVRRRRLGQGRHRHAVHRRQEGRRGEGRRDARERVSPPTSDATWARTPARPSPPDYGPQSRVQRQVKGVQLAIEDAEEQITSSLPEERPSASRWRGSNAPLLERRQPSMGWRLPAGAEPEWTTRRATRRP